MNQEHNQQPQARLTVLPAPSEEGMTLKVGGEIDAMTVSEFRDAVFTAIGARPRLLILDLTPVAAVDTVGLETLVTIARVARTVSVNLRMVASPHLMRTLALTGLDRALPLLPEQEGAQ